MEFWQLMIQLRRWEDQRFPLAQSRIAFDLLLLVASKSKRNEPSTMKFLFNTLPYSERGIRNVIGQFVESGWLQVVGSRQDKRAKIVVPSDQMAASMKEYEELFRKLSLDLLKS